MASVLLVENNRMLRTMYTAGMSGYGYNVHEATSLNQAFDLLEEGLVPDILITDWKLVGGSVESLVQAVESVSPNVRVIIATGHANAVTCRADHILPKNTGIMEILSLI
ncbi:MAG: response regulator [Chloroflexota bacterium]